MPALITPRLKSTHLDDYGGRTVVESVHELGRVSVVISEEKGEGDEVAVIAAALLTPTQARALAVRLIESAALIESLS